MENDLTSDFLSQYDDSLYPVDLADRFEALECLNCNQTGETLLIRDITCGKMFVAKCFYEGHPLYEAAEPEPLRALSHTGLPAFAEEFRGNGTRCVLREYIYGKTLFEKSAEAPFTDEDVRSVGIQLCGILKYLHSQKPPVIHRDIKPQNIIIRDDGSLALIDLGISRLFEAGVQEDTVLCGTQDFAPPEQYGFMQTDSRSDIYSLGILLAWMMTGRARPISEPRTSLEHTIKKCAAFAPGDRYKDADAVSRALTESRPAVRKKKRLLYGAAGLIALALLINAFIWPGQRAPAYANEANANPVFAPSATVKTAAGFTEPLIEDAVRLMLGKSADEPLSPTEIASVTEIYINNGSVYKDINSFCTAHEEWNLQGAKGRGPVTSLEDLKKLPNLRVLCAAAEQITDISPLASLPGLFQVELRVNNVSDISPLSGLGILTHVGLNSNPVEDISPLACCPSLQLLDLCGVTGNYDGSDLQKLGDLEFLDISNRTDSYKYLGGKTIRELKLAKTAFSDLSYLGDVKGLRRLELCQTPLSDLSGLENQPELTYLDLCGIPADDFSVLLKLPELREVTVEVGARELIEPVAAEGSFSVTYR